MKLPTLFMGVIALAGTIDAPQNYEKGLCQFVIVWSHPPQYQNGGVRLVFLIPSLCLLGCC